MTTLTVMADRQTATGCPSTFATSSLATAKPRRCELDYGHRGPHKATNALAEPVYWPRRGRHAA